MSVNSSYDKSAKGIALDGFVSSLYVSVSYPLILLGQPCSSFNKETFHRNGRSLQLLTKEKCCKN
jgi:hypothetical protein